MKILSVKKCWARGFSIKEAGERSYTDEGSIREEYKELEREMREYFLEQQNKEDILIKSPSFTKEELKSFLDSMKASNEKQT